MRRRLALVAWVCVPLLAAAPRLCLGQADLQQALGGSRIKGGLCVLVGCADAELPARIAGKGPMLVECLSPDAGKVGAAREALLARGLYGQVTMRQWPGPALPYASDLVSLLVVLERGETTDAELLRVLRPGGEMIAGRGGRFVATSKPRPEGMDEWTHWRHGPDRNAVSTDRLVDVPREVQWLFTRDAVGERSHVVCANGRYFAQDRHVLIARDAFNGLPLWTAPLKKGDDFHWEWSVKVSALVVARGERVYCLAEDGKFKALDAATGKPLAVYADAGVPYDVLLIDDGRSALGTLALAGRDSVRALDANSGRLLWKLDANNPHALIASETGVFYIEGSDRRGAARGEISGRELLTGRLMWKKDYDWARRTELGAFGCDRIVYEMRSPSNWREFYAQHPEQKEADRYALVVISARTGEEIEKIRGTGTSARHGEFRRGFWYKGRLLTEAYSREGLSIAMFYPEDFTRPAEMFKANYAGDRGFGHCYPPVLTDRFYLNGQLNFTDLETRRQVSNQITRGSCNTSRSGYVPANGMIYTFPKHCICFPMLEGNVCLSPARGAEPPAEHELARGPAWPAQPLDGGTPADWPTFRHDAFRSSGTHAPAPERLDVIWSRQITGPDYAGPLAAEWQDNPFAAGAITAPVVAAGRVYVAQSDTHQLIALDEASGEPRWRFVADGRIDGPPTIHRGMCLFGCRSGWVYNLRAADGAMIWKLRVAPHERRISVYGQLESPWPVPGSVLVADGLAYVGVKIHNHFQNYNKVRAREQGW